LNRIRVGVIGVGHLGKFHADNYTKIPEAELIGIYDIDEEKSKALADRFGCIKFKTLDSLLDRVEAVTISVPTDQHFDIAKRVIDREIHCMIEKPITESLKQADYLIDQAQKRKVVLHVGHIERFNPALRALKNIELNPLFIESHRLSPFNPRGTEVSVILDLMIHDIDIVLDTVKSRPDKIDASGVAVISKSVDIANARIHFENGCVANLTASRISQKKMRKMRLFQKDAYISIDFLEMVSEIFRLGKKPEEGYRVIDEIGEDKKLKILYSRPRTPEKLGLQKELEIFLSAVNGEQVEGVTGEDAREALSVALQILEQIEK